MEQPGFIGEEKLPKIGKPTDIAHWIWEFGMWIIFSNTINKSKKADKFPERKYRLLVAAFFFRRKKCKIAFLFYQGEKKFAFRKFEYIITLLFLNTISTKELNKMRNYTIFTPPPPPNSDSRIRKSCGFFPNRHNSTFLFLLSPEKSLKTTHFFVRCRN